MTKELSNIQEDVLISPSRVKEMTTNQLIELNALLEKHKMLIVMEIRKRIQT